MRHRYSPAHLRAVMGFLPVLWILACSGEATSPPAGKGPESPVAPVLASPTASGSPSPVPVAADSSPCGHIKFDSKTSKAFDVVSVEATWNEPCTLIVQAKANIEFSEAVFVFYDSSGVKLGDDNILLQEMKAGDKAKEEIRYETGTTRIEAHEGD